MALDTAPRLPDIRIAPCILLEHGRQLGPVGIALYTALKLYANRTTQQCFPKVTTLATLIGASPRTVKQHLPMLYRLGLVQVRPRYLSASKRTSNLYTLVDPTHPTAVKAAQDAYARKSLQNRPGVTLPSPTTPRSSTEASAPLRGSETPKTPIAATESTLPPSAPPSPGSIGADSARRSIGANPAPSIPIGADSAPKLVPTSLTSERAATLPRSRSLTEPPSPTPPTRVEVPPAPELCLVDPTHGPLRPGHWSVRCNAEAIHETKPGPAASRARHRVPLEVYGTAAD
jgi:hypothetical protein